MLIVLLIVFSIYYNILIEMIQTKEKTLLYIWSLKKNLYKKSIRLIHD